MIVVQDVVRELCKMGLTGVTVEWDKIKEMFYYNLNTGAKSGLSFYEDFHVEGRYQYHNQIDSEQPIDQIIKDLFYEFKGCIHGRDFYNEDWMVIGVQLGCVEKKVTTHTTIEYK